MNNCPFLNNLWRDMAGKEELPIRENPNHYTLNEIRRQNCFHPELLNFEKIASKWTFWPSNIDFNTFNRLANNRMIQGYFRYGQLGFQGNINRSAYLVKKSAEYERSGNLECLLDIWNVGRAEWIERTNPKAYFLGYYEFYPEVSLITRLQLRSKCYSKFGSLHALLDLCNFARLEWCKKTHPKAHFQALDDQQHGERY